MFLHAPTPRALLPTDAQKGLDLALVLLERVGFVQAAVDAEVKAEEVLEVVLWVQTDIAEFESVAHTQID